MTLFLLPCFQVLFNLVVILGCFAVPQFVSGLLGAETEHRYIVYGDPPVCLNEPRAVSPQSLSGEAGFKELS